MEKTKKIISVVPSQYEINTGTIFILLTGSDEKWKKYDRQFLIKDFQDAINSVLWQKSIFTVQYDGKNGTYLKNYEEIKYPGALKNSEDIRIFPFPEYFLKEDEESEYMNIVNYGMNCLINKWDYNFDLFFSLQFSLTEIVKCDESQAEDFLKFHLQNTFDNDFQKFKIFLENLCLKYSEFLKNKYEPLVKRFIENEISAKKELEQTNSEASVNPTDKVKLNWLGSPSQFAYVLLQLAEKGFIELPSTSGQGSYSRYAKVCWDLFEFQNKTTTENLQKEMNPKKNTLSDGIRAKFTLPSLNEISKKQKQ